jgi:hypothetical protein
MVQNCGLWRARLWDVDHELYLGHFETAKQAARAYDLGAIWCEATRYTTLLYLCCIEVSSEKAGTKRPVQ